MNEVRCVYHDRATLGEGVFWSAREKRVYWIDIEGKRVCRFDPNTGKNESVNVGQQVGAVVENRAGGLIAALKDGVYALDFASGALSKWCDPLEGDEASRLNDGKAGPDGRFYIGGVGPDAQQKLYRVDLDGHSLAEIETGVTCSNGLAWSEDNRTLYYVDSPQRVVFAYDFDAITGTVSRRRVAVDVTGIDAVPDGMTIDAEDKLWVAFWEGGCVRRVDPATGNTLEEIPLPVSRVTCCAFGGANLDTLYITTASVGFEEADWEREPLAGGLFAVKPGVRGREAFLFGI